MGKYTKQIAAAGLAFLLCCFTSCNVSGKNPPVRATGGHNWMYSEEVYAAFGSPQLSNYIHQGSLLADITIDSWLRDDDYKPSREPMDLYTYYSARVNTVYKGDQGLKGKKILFAQHGIEETTFMYDVLPAKGDRMLAFLTENNSADENAYTTIGYNQGVFTILNFQGVTYAVKQYRSFADLEDLEVDSGLLQKIVAYKYKEGGYPPDRGIDFTFAEDPYKDCDPQAFVLKDLEVRIAEIAAG